MWVHLGVRFATVRPIFGFRGDTKNITQTAEDLVSVAVRVLEHQLVRR